MNSNPEVRRGVASGYPCATFAVVGVGGGEDQSLMDFAQFAIPVTRLEECPNVVACT